VSLLFYMGLLTIDKPVRSLLSLKIPNYSIQTVFWEYISRLVLDRNKDIMINRQRLNSAIWELSDDGKPAPFLDYMSQHIFSCFSNRDLQDFSEKYIKVMILSILFQNGMFTPISEMEVSTGYTDIWLKRSHLFPDIPYEWVWELKYIKKSDEANAALLDAARTSAREQLTKYHASHLFADRNDVRYLSLIFIGKDKYEMEEIKF
jgi:hypothetical protein